ncbi:unnamed protein product [Linum tenue]|uniref:Carboxypeptidase n=2 Tax=Linum tenue TaxID=586396 RepID=A0AAV0JZT6_9ROSI|nr:unnamed protein product [Linum tenue]
MDSPSFSNNIITVLCLFLLCNLPCFPSSSVTFPKEALPTKSGYLPVDPAKPGSAIFYTFYEAQQPSSPSLSTTPLVFWLQGGPGCSSMIGNFFELGPYLVTPELGLTKNPGSWNRIFGLVFLDNPIGTGFSTAASPLDIPRDQNAVASHLFSAISAFLRGLGPDSKTRPLYITGESYAGKYVPAIGSYIVRHNANLPESRLNLKGVAIGDGLTDPVTQVQTHALNAYFSGLINDLQREEMERAQSEAVRFVGMEKWKEATEARNRVLNMLQNMTGLATLYDFTKTEPYKTELVVALLASPEVKAALNANTSIVFEECGKAAAAALHEDVMKSTKGMVEELLLSPQPLRVLLYQGQHDLRDGVVSVEAWMKTIRRWGGLSEFLAARREVWRVDGLLAGYVQRSETGRLTHAVVLGAGHLVPTDQPVNAQAMIEGWILETGPFAAGKGQQQQRVIPDHYRWQY